MKTSASMRVCENFFKQYQLLIVQSGKKILIAGVFLVLIAGCQTGESCKKVLNEKCIRCHSISTSCAKVGKGEEQWHKILDAMVKLGADVSKKERKTLARCLGNPSGADVEGVCK